MSKVGDMLMEGLSEGARRAVIVAVATLCLSRTGALAAPAMPTIVLESSVGERPANVDRILAPLLDSLAEYGFVVKPTMIAKLLGPQAPQPGILDRGRTATEIAQQIESGLDAFRAGRFKDAEDALAGAVQLVKRNPGLWVLDGSNASLTYNAFVKLAVAQSQNGRTEDSFATMMELVRMSSTPISQSNYGPRAERLWKGAQKLAQTMGRGSLVANVSDSHAVIFVDGAFRGMGKIALGDLIPGPRHVFVQVGGDARQYEIEVRPNDESSVNIDWHIDSVLSVAEPWAGFAFSNESERAGEGVYARALARKWGSERVVVVGLTRLEGNLEVVGTVYPADGTAARRASVPVSEGAEGMHSLARFLFDGTRTGHLNVIDRGPGLSSSVSAKQAPKHGVTLASKLVLGAGGVAVVSGVVAYVLSPDDDVTLAYNERRAFAIQFATASSSVLAAGVYLSLRDSTSAGRPSSALLGMGAGSLVAGSLLYLTDEDPVGNRPQFRDSATIGVIVGGSGLVASGLGAWLWYRERRRGGVLAPPSPGERTSSRSSAAPTISAGASHVVLGYGGTF